MKAVRSTEGHLQWQQNRKTNNPTKAFDLSKEEKSHEEQMNKTYFVLPFLLALKSKEDLWMPDRYFLYDEMHQEIPLILV